MPVEMQKHLSEPSYDELSFDLSQRRTGLSFQRTRMSADRTLMSVIRTSLSLISFGFTIYQFFHSLKESGAARVPTMAGIGNFSLWLVIVGVGMLILGIIYHVTFMLQLRKERATMISQKMLMGKFAYPVSMTFLVAVALLIIGMAAMFSMLTRTGPFA